MTTYEYFVVYMLPNNKTSNTGANLEHKLDSIYQVRKLEEKLAELHEVEATAITNFILLKVNVSESDMVI